MSYFRGVKSQLMGLNDRAQGWVVLEILGRAIILAYNDLSAVSGHDGRDKENTQERCTWTQDPKAKIRCEDFMLKVLNFLTFQWPNSKLTLEFDGARFAVFFNFHHLWVCVKNWKILKDTGKIMELDLGKAFHWLIFYILLR